MGRLGAPAVQGSRPTAAETGDYGGTPACRREEEQEQHRLNQEEQSRSRSRGELLEVLSVGQRGCTAGLGGAGAHLSPTDGPWSLAEQQQLPDVTSGSYIVGLVAFKSHARAFTRIGSICSALNSVCKQH